MTTVDITLENSPSKSNDLSGLVIFNQVQIYCSGYTQLSDLINISNSDNSIDTATDEVCKRMNSDIDELIKDARIELLKAKKIIKEKYPYRNKFEIVKLFFKNPKLFIYAYNKTHGN